MPDVIWLLWALAVVLALILALAVYALRLAAQAAAWGRVAAHARAVEARLAKHRANRGSAPAA
jgi:hypothetical protein